MGHMNKPEIPATIQRLAEAAAECFLADQEYYFWREDGNDAGGGFTTVYNQETGQSKKVLFHAESSLIFKLDTYGMGETSPKFSRRDLGFITYEGKEIPVRLPEFYYVNADDVTIEVQEYVDGSRCDCLTWGDCDHSKEVKRVTRCQDAHYGNWKINSKGELILFDFDGIRL